MVRVSKLSKIPKIKMSRGIKAEPVPKELGVKYLDATKRQLTKAKAQHPLYSKTSLSQDVVLDALQMECRSSKMPEVYKSYDRWGRPTTYCKGKREQDLQRFKLPQTATVKEYLDSLCQKFIEDTRKFVRRLDKANARRARNGDTSIGPKKVII
jgi:hypothetical protein